MTESTNESMSTQSECSNECTICLLQYTDETKKATECQHIFHQECIDRWLQENNSCPLCRTCLQQHTRPIIDEEEEEEEEDPNINYGLGFGGGGGLMQLVAYGARDRMLSSNEMGSSIQWLDYEDITLPQISQLDGRASSHEEARPEQHQPSGSYNYSRMQAMQTIMTWRRHNFTSTIATEQTPPRRTHREQQHQQQQSRRSQIKYNNTQNQRRYK